MKTKNKNNQSTKPSMPNKVKRGFPVRPLTMTTAFFHKSTL